jgi:hypothetical protein
MNCERAVDLLTGTVDEASAADRRAASAHAAGCRDCRDAVTAAYALRLANLAPVPSARSGAVDRVLASVARAPSVERATAGRFWLGMGLGAALAAGVAFAIVMFAPFDGAGLSSATPKLEMALNEARNIDISLTTPEALVDAEIHVTLQGAVGLSGYPGQRELMWRTDLDAGSNRLTLPIVAVGEEGGQVMVEVIHGGKRRTFLVDVLAHG